MSSPLYRFPPSKFLLRQTAKPNFMRKEFLFRAVTILLLFSSFNAKSQREAWAKEGSYSAITVDAFDNLLAAQGTTLTKFDTSGNVIWNKSYNYGFTSLCYTPDGSLYGATGNQLLKISADGQVVWEVPSSGGLVTASTNDAIYAGSVLSFTKYSAQGVAQFTKTLSINSLFPLGQNLSADKAGNIHVNFSTSGTQSVYINPFSIGTLANTVIVFDGNGNYLNSKQLTQGSLDFGRGYKAGSDANHFVYTSFRGFLNSSSHWGYLNTCTATGTCLTVNPINPDFDNFSRNYFAGSIVGNASGPNCTDQNIDVCGNTFTGVLNKMLVSIAGNILTPNANSATQDIPSWLAADPAGRSLYILATWSQLMSGSTFNFAGSQLSNPGGMILRYGVNSPVSIPLPVIGLSLSGKTQNNENVLTWTTIAEVNNDHFEVERSIDGIFFAPVASVYTKAVNGNSNIPLTYFFRDQKQPASVVYYQIKQIDKSGKISYSNVINLQNSSITSLSLYPNPAKGVVRLVLNAENAGKVFISVVDITGRELIRKTANTTAGVNNIDINVSTIAPGTYLVKANFSSGQRSETIKLIKE
jgi:hypothetical protein